MVGQLPYSLTFATCKVILAQILPFGSSGSRCALEYSILSTPLRLMHNTSRRPYGPATEVPVHSVLFHLKLPFPSVPLQHAILLCRWASIGTIWPLDLQRSLTAIKVSFVSWVSILAQCTWNNSGFCLNFRYITNFKFSDHFLVSKRCRGKSWR